MFCNVRGLLRRDLGLRSIPHRSEGTAGRNLDTITIEVTREVFAAAEEKSVVIG
jgi:hypothetical protein